MKLIIASDIHGDIECAKALFKRADIEKAEKILLLGDLLYHGPRNDLPESYAPKEVISLLNQNRDKLLCVRGNCDSEVDQMVLDFPIMSDTAYFYDSEAGVNLFMSHGHKYSPESLPPLSEKTVFLYGHTHVYKSETVGNIMCVNPGSVSLPKNNNPKTYATYERGKIEIRSLDGAILTTLIL